MSENIRIYFHPQPDEMTFEQFVMHVRRTMYWDYLDGQWCDISLYPLGQWKLLEEQLKAAHGREMEQLEVENAKLRELVTVMRSKVPVRCYVNGCRDTCPNVATCEREAELADELGIEVS